MSRYLFLLTPIPITDFIALARPHMPPRAALLAGGVFGASSDDGILAALESAEEPG